MIQTGLFDSIWSKVLTDAELGLRDGWPFRDYFLNPFANLRKSLGKVERLRIKSLGFRAGFTHEGLGPGFARSRVLTVGAGLRA